MKEIDLSRGLVKELRTGICLPNSVVFKHTDAYTSGVLDISVTWLRHTSWLEAKVARGGKVEGRGIQHQTAIKLAAVSDCWYVIYEFKEKQRNTHIVHPLKIFPDGTWDPTEIFPGLNHQAVATFVSKRHSSLWDRSACQYCGRDPR